MSSDDEAISRASSISDNEAVENDIIQVEDNLQENNDEQETEEVQRDGTADGEPGGDGEEAAGGDRVPVKPKKVIRNPQPKLNSQTLKGPKGIAALPSYFERTKFKGKGYEQQDLKAILKTYEYWCHRLFPKFPFETCVERLEKLGHKKDVQAHIRRIRFDLLVEERPIVDSSDEENNVEGFVNNQEERVEEHSNVAFDELLTTTPTQATPSLSDEQLERIRLNKEKAEKIRQERLKKIQEKARENLEVSKEVPGTSGLSAVLDEQADILTQKSCCEEPAEFDFASNIRGKTTVSGSTVKKKGKKQLSNNVNNACDNEAQITNGLSILDSDEDSRQISPEREMESDKNRVKDGGKLRSLENDDSGLVLSNNINGHLDPSETSKDVPMDIDGDLGNKENSSA